MASSMLPCDFNILAKLEYASANSGFILMAFL
jgi:hypothetical protein